MIDERVLGNEQLFTIPSATYRVQLNAHFRFHDLEEILPYLSRLGISHVYLSPCLRARPGSTHGYDILNHGELNPELGSLDDFRSLATKLRSLGMGQIFDMVPNHMGILGNANPWWNDILENGRASTYAKYFDIDWSFSLKQELKDKVLLPILGQTYGQALESGELRLDFRDGQFRILYFDHIFPISPCSVEPLLESGSQTIETALSATNEDFLEYRSILTGVKNLPKRTETEPGRIAERIREKDVIRRRLDALSVKNSVVLEALQQVVTTYNGTVGTTESFDLLDDLLNAQAYRLSYFRVAADEINYRRFFDVNELAALNMERPEVFAQTHSLFFELLRDGLIQGLRIDHIDGLYDPKGYLSALHKAFEEYAAGSELYLVIEKILGVSEFLPNNWKLHGTTGYDFLAAVNLVFVDPANEKHFNRIYSRWSAGTPSASDVAYECKYDIQRTSLSAELHVLAQQLDRISEENRHSRDFTLAAQMNALRDIIACFPVYRSYVDEGGVSAVDRKHIELAVHRARRKNPAVHASLFDFIRNTLLLQAPENASEQYRDSQLAFVRKFQQVTSPVAAKGVEDTSFYIYNRLLSLNEVGSTPEDFGASPEEFHITMEARQRSWPHALSALATHDTKRGEDTRARLNVLSEIPEEFEKAIATFDEINRQHVVETDGGLVPDKNTLYLLYQTLIGTWPFALGERDLPIFRDRIHEYMQKAIHEAKQFTSWINPDLKYDAAVRTFVERVLDPSNAGFLAEMEKFLPRVVICGMLNSLSQTVLKICCPGVPDTYQGTELWDFSLVDPDNRRPVDFGARSEKLDALNREFESSTPEARRRNLGGMLKDLKEGDAKLFIASRLLNARRTYPGLFTAGNYLPAIATGLRKQNIIAFARKHGSSRCLVATPRLYSDLIAANNAPEIAADTWGDTNVAVPDAGLNGDYLDILSGRKVEVRDTIHIAELLADFPIAVLIAP